MAVVIVAVIVTLALVGGLVMNAFQSLGTRPPAPGTTIVAPSDSKATQAAADATGGSDAQAAAEYLASQPTAYWLTPEADPVDEVWNRIAALAADAREQDAALAVVVYGLPERDCGNLSAGGLDDASYVTWTQQIGDALRNASDLQRIVILEPDSLALAPECGNVDARTTQLRGAADRLAGPGIWTYLDGGHSDWLSAGEMAGLIRGVGLQNIRGFATNVSNYNATDDEVAYAHELAGLLDGAHAVIDTSRNGRGSNGEWCNPRGREVGEPGGSIGDDVVDTNLWIKPPGESDGTCNGGPVAGTWWPDAAIELTRAAR
ncbi:glycoside hydrolase family 6 protein [Microbacterium sp. P02]|uniref:glycoside hydrolase family 6 protein n=1 Tax=unclassified Microbacterium TaxID=2609290 RepID=UPI003670E9EC